MRSREDEEEGKIFLDYLYVLVVVGVTQYILLIELNRIDLCWSFTGTTTSFVTFSMLTLSYEEMTF